MTLSRWRGRGRAPRVLLFKKEKKKRAHGHHEITHRGGRRARDTMARQLHGKSSPCRENVFTACTAGPFHPRTQMPRLPKGAPGVWGAFRRESNEACRNHNRARDTRVALTDSVSILLDLSVRLANALVPCIRFIASNVNFQKCESLCKFLFGSLSHAEISPSVAHIVIWIFVTTK